MVNKNLEKIRKELKKHKEGCTLSEIARITKLSRNTVRVYIERLMGERRISIRNIGPSKLIKYKK